MDKTKDFMTPKPLSVLASSSMFEAMRLMKEHSIRHLPVFNEAHQLVGILSDRDVQLAMTVTKSNPLTQEIALDPKLRVEDFMNWPVHVVAETTPLVRVAEEMLAQKVSAFVVLDDQQKVKGIITTDDVLSYFLQQSKERNLPGKSLAFYFAQR